MLIYCREGHVYRNTPWKLNVAPGAQLLYLHHLFRLQLSEHADKVKVSNIGLKQN